MSKPSILTDVEPSVELQPIITKNILVLKNLPVKSQNIIVLLFQLFYDILDDEQLTKKLWNVLMGTLEDGGNPEDPIVSNLPERQIGRIQRRK